MQKSGIRAGPFRRDQCRSAEFSADPPTARKKTFDNAAGAGDFKKRTIAVNGISNEIKIQARLTAIEYLVAKLFAAMLVHAPEEAFDELQESYRLDFELKPLLEHDPALTEAVSAEIRREVMRLLEVVDELLKMERA